MLGDGTAEFRAKAEANASPLATRLFGVDGVTGVFLGSDFISVTKGDGEWQHIKPAILGAIMEHYMSGAPAVESDEAANDSEHGDYDPKDEDTVKTIKELLDTRVRPAVANDGGDIVFHGFKDGVVFLHMRGACAGCPSSTATLAPRHREPAPAFLPGRAGSSSGLIAGRCHYQTEGPARLRAGFSLFMHGSLLAGRWP